MSNDKRCEIYIDGAAKGNPGPASYAYIIKWCGGEDAKAAFIGESTNNVAEYSALIAALERAESLNCRRVTVYADSQLLIKQMRGEYRVRSSALKRLHERALQLLNRFSSIEFVYISREMNGEADELANKVLKIKKLE